MANQRATAHIRNVDVLDSTLQKTNIWLKELESLLHTDDKPKAYAALRAVLHTLRECMPVEETAKFASQMPLLMRGVFFDGWKPRKKPLRMTKGRFFGAIREALRNQVALDPALAARAVFKTLENHLSDGEIAAVRRILPAEVRQFWADVDAQGEQAGEPRETGASAAPHWQPGWAARQAGARSGGVTDLPYWTR